MVLEGPREMGYGSNITIGNGFNGSGHIQKFSNGLGHRGRPGPHPQGQQISDSFKAQNGLPFKAHKRISFKAQNGFYDNAHNRNSYQAQRESNRQVGERTAQAIKGRPRSGRQFYKAKSNIRQSVSQAYERRGKAVKADAITDRGVSAANEGGIKELSEPMGDILVFLTGQDDIDTAVQLLTEEAQSSEKPSSGLIVLPLYSGLSRSDQDRVFSPAPRGKRKVVISTNIAETSLTLEGVVYVVDSGFSKQRFYNPISDIENLIVAPISKASARQRAGRAGRVRPGNCYRVTLRCDGITTVIRNFYEFILAIDLVDLPLEGVRFPWANNRNTL
ncbi:hypothetical protein F0562_001463 [Nyssa sinensis]|uniref:RNA helicase n=1 Tax=Nyssa sinensis TaxID=561372 RepID=A0A5J5C2X4_9ASTE|nr:hypothetical protein F0562_001463 [Nyssa sinensis]